MCHVCLKLEKSCNGHLKFWAVREHVSVAICVGFAAGWTRILVPTYRGGQWHVLKVIKNCSESSMCCGTFVEAPTDPYWGQNEDHFGQFARTVDATSFPAKPWRSWTAVVLLKIQKITRCWVAPRRSAVYYLTLPTLDPSNSLGCGKKTDCLNSLLRCHLRMSTSESMLGIWAPFPSQEVCEHNHENGS